jgi:hypothetical protein
MPGGANPYGAEQTWNAPPIIYIHSPLDNEIFSPNTVPLGFAITTPEHGWLVRMGWASSGRVIKNKLSYVSIIIDGKLYRSIEADSDLSSPFSYYEYLTSLEDGAHNLTIKAYCDGWYVEIHGLWDRYLPYDVSSDLIDFTIDSTSPVISILSPENASFESTENILDVTLNFTVNEPVSQVIYSLDGRANVTVAGNTTLTDLPYGEHNVTLTDLSNGSHNITAYVKDTFGNVGASETVYFSVKLPEPQPEPEPFPTTFVIASVITVAVVGIGLLVYFKKRHAKSGDEE